LFGATLEHGVIHSDLDPVSGSSDEVAILSPVNRGRDAGSEPSFQANPGHLRFPDYGQLTGQDVLVLVGSAFHDRQRANGLMGHVRGRSRCLALRRAAASRRSDCHSNQFFCFCRVQESRAIQLILRKISTVAARDASVLLLGETGTGKELIARAIHEQSPRVRGPFIGINCSAIPAPLFESELFGHERGSFTGAAGPQKGKFELANLGTLFLDEIGEMPLELQPKLLRILENRTFYRLGSSIEQKSNVRLIAATSKDLGKAIAEGKFREDLYHRLNVVLLHVPPLRDRSEDIPTLAQAFIREFSGGAKTLAADALEYLQSLQWKGNVRELRNTVERISIFLERKEVSRADLMTLDIIDPGSNSPSASFLKSLVRGNTQGADLLEALEKQLVRLTMEETQGNASHAAKLLGIDRNALLRRLDKFGLT